MIAALVLGPLRTLTAVVAVTWVVAASAADGASRPSPTTSARAVVATSRTRVERICRSFATGPGGGRKSWRGLGKGVGPVGHNCHKNPKLRRTLNAVYKTLQGGGEGFGAPCQATRGGHLRKF